MWLPRRTTDGIRPEQRHPTRNGPRTTTETARTTPDHPQLL